jgi:hypothetical protein
MPYLLRVAVSYAHGGCVLAVKPFVSFYCLSLAQLQGMVHTGYIVRPAGYNE